MLRHRMPSLLVLLTVLAFCASRAEAAKKVAKRKLDDPSTCKFSFKGPGGHYYIRTKEGVTWRLVPSDVDEDYSWFFFNLDTQETQWTDPRVPDDHNKMIMEIHLGKVIKKKNVYSLDDNGEVVKEEIILSDVKQNTDALINQMLKERDTKVITEGQKDEL